MTSSHRVSSRPRVYYDEDLDDFETLDDDLYRRLRSRRPRLLRHIIDDDLSSESTPPRKISSRVSLPDVDLLDVDLRDVDLICL